MQVEPSRTVIKLRSASTEDLPSILRIYNEGIEDRIATLETDLKTSAQMLEWFVAHSKRYAVVVALDGESVVGWASLNPYTHRCAYRGVADLSVYVARSHRGRGIGSLLMEQIERSARESEFHKLVLFALTKNQAGQALYSKMGFRTVGVFREQGVLDGCYMDVIAMEKLLD